MKLLSQKRYGHLKVPFKLLLSMFFNIDKKKKKKKYPAGQDHHHL